MYTAHRRKDVGHLSQASRGTLHTCVNFLDALYFFKIEPNIMYTAHRRKDVGHLSQASRDTLHTFVNFLDALYF